MFVQIQYCVDGTGDIKSKWAVYVAPNQLTIKELFNKIHAGKLLLFRLLKDMVYPSVMHFFQGIPMLHHVLKQTFLFLKSLWCLGYNKCSAYELSCYTYG